MSFDHPYTCPDIDKNIALSKEAFEEFLQEFITENVPLMSQLPNLGHDLGDYFKTQAESLYDCVEFAYEDLRTSNEDMRKSAESQISELEDIISDHESTIKELRAQLEDSY